MFFFMTLGMSFMIVTGFALYAEGLGADHWLSVITAPVMNLVGNSQAMHSLHHLGMWAIVVFIMIHIYAAVREDIMVASSSHHDRSPLAAYSLSGKSKPVVLGHLYSASLPCFCGQRFTQANVTNFAHQLLTLFEIVLQISGHLRSVQRSLVHVQKQRS